MENTKKTHEEEIKEIRTSIRLMKEERRERNRPTVWKDRENRYIEIHYNNRTIIAKITNIDNETPREASDEMARGSGFRQIIYKTEEED